MSHLSSDNVVSLHVIILSADFFRGRYEVIDEFRKSLWTNVIIVWKPGEVEAVFVNYTQNQIRIPSGPALSVCIKSNLILIGLITITAVKTKWIPKNRFRNKYLGFIFWDYPNLACLLLFPRGDSEDLEELEDSNLLILFSGDSEYVDFLNESTDDDLLFLSGDSEYLEVSILLSLISEESSYFGSNQIVFTLGFL